MKKQKNYVKIANVLKECVDYAMSLKVNMEDPNGVRQDFQISDISISLINNEYKNLFFKNGVVDQNTKNSNNTEMFITIWIQNEYKIVKGSFAHGGLILDPIYLKIHFNRIIRFSIQTTFKSFFSEETKNNKYSVKSEDNVENHLYSLKPLEDFSNDGIIQLKKLFQDLYKIDNIYEVDGEVTLSRKAWFVCNNKGTNIMQHQDLCSIEIDFSCISSKQTLIEDVFVEHCKSFDVLINSLPDIKTKISKKLKKVEQIRIDGGMYPIIFKSSASATFIHEAIAGHMLSGKFISNGISTVFENRLNKELAPQEEMPGLFQISIFDTPSRKDQMGHYKYDMEGVKAKDICLFENGIVKSYFTDKNSAERLKVENNGHSLAQSFLAIDEEGFLIAREPEPRISNLFVESHTDITFQEMCNMVFEQSEFNFYLEVESRSGQVRVDTGVFDLFANHITKVYKDGRREVIAPGTFSGNLTDFLSSISVVSNHYGETKGFCGSGSGRVPTHSKAPAMLLYGINFITNPKPEKEENIDLKKDKYIPKNW